jgi:hypothetical protein
MSADMRISFKGVLGMIFSVKKWIERIKFVLLFVLLTYLSSLVLHTITEWIEPAQRYKAPSGKALKVLQQEAYSDPDSFQDRLRFFYWYGE